MAEHSGVFDHVGLLSNEPPGTAGLPFIQSSDIGADWFLRLRDDVHHNVWGGQSKWVAG
jgi:hypothetical protein